MSNATRAGRCLEATRARNQARAVYRAALEAYTASADTLHRTYSRPERIAALQACRALDNQSTSYQGRAT